MTRRMIIDSFPDAIKDELIEKVLERKTQRAIVNWLFQAHGITCSKSAISRFCKPISDKFFVLVNLGMPIKEIVKHRPQIEALGVEQVKQQLLDKLAEKTGSLFAYLDETEGGPMKSTTPQSQLDKIKADLLNGGRVDSVAAFSQHGITRLAAIIKRLRDSGWPIVTAQDNSNGLAHYSLPDGWRPDTKKP